MTLAKQGKRHIWRPLLARAPTILAVRGGGGPWISRSFQIKLSIFKQCSVYAFHICVAYTQRKDHIEKHVPTRGGGEFSRRVLSCEFEWMLLFLSNF